MYPRLSCLLNEIYHQHCVVTVHICINIKCCIRFSWQLAILYKCCTIISVTALYYNGSRSVLLYMHYWNIHSNAFLSTLL